MKPAQTLQFALIGLAAMLVAASATLQALGIDATQSWTTLGTIIGLVAGQHLPSPK